MKTTPNITKIEKNLTRIPENFRLKDDLPQLNQGDLINFKKSINKTKRKIAKAIEKKKRDLLK